MKTLHESLMARNRLIHLCITQPKSNTGLEIQSIEIRTRKGDPRVWRFNESP